MSSCEEFDIASVHSGSEVRRASCSYLIQASWLEYMTSHFRFTILIQRSSAKRTLAAIPAGTTRRPRVFQIGAEKAAFIYT